MITSHERLLVLAQSLDERYGGMASIRVTYQPYKCQWEAQASWSSGETVTIAKRRAMDAMELLAWKLQRLQEDKSACTLCSGV